MLANMAQNRKPFRNTSTEGLKLLTCDCHLVRAAAVVVTVVTQSVAEKHFALVFVSLVGYLDGNLCLRTILLLTIHLDFLLSFKRRSVGTQDATAPHDTITRPDAGDQRAHSRIRMSEA